MTLSLSMVTPRFVMQVTDRLVTTSPGNKFDQTSNKNVIFVARNAVVTIGYSGLAYLNDVTTDEWIAKVLVGIEPSRQDNDLTKGIRFGGKISKGYEIGNAIEQVQISAENALSKENIPAQSKMLEIIFTGWQWRRKPNRIIWRPIAYGVLLKSKRGKIVSSVFGLKRYWHFEGIVREKLGLRWPFRLLQIPVANTKPDLLTRSLIKRLSPVAKDPEKVRQILVNEIKSRSQTQQTIGKDCMCIYIPVPSELTIEATYLAHEIEPKFVVGEIMYSAGFSPWIVGSHIQVPPSIIMGSMTTGVGSIIGRFECKVRGPSQQSALPAEGPRINSYFSSQKRPPKPK
jgi:hypothetical protein